MGRVLGFHAALSSLLSGKKICISQDSCVSSWQFLHCFIIKKTANSTLKTSDLCSHFVKNYPVVRTY